jgi:ADP-ribosyl-[dinitrogen reductase] hydrolase
MADLFDGHHAQGVGIWQTKVEGCEWQEVPAHIAAKLDAEFTLGRKKAVFKLNKADTSFRKGDPEALNYEVDFSTMAQTCIEAPNRKRMVRRCANLLRPTRHQPVAPAYAEKLTSERFGESLTKSKIEVEQLTAAAAADARSGRRGVMGSACKKPTAAGRTTSMENRSGCDAEADASCASSGKVTEQLRQLLQQLDYNEDERLIAVVPAAKNDLNSYALLANVPIDRKKALVSSALRDRKLDRFMGPLCGMGVGDMLGHPFEFEPAQDEPGDARFDLTTMRFYGEANAFRLQRGQWTDDASMGLCMADSLIVRRGFDGSDMRVRFWCWWNRGYNNAFRKDPSRSSSVGLGGNISKSLDALSLLRRGQRAPDRYEAKTDDAGNGSLMRFAPVALFFHAASWEEVYHYARASSYTTHPGIIAAEACSLLAHIIVRAVNLPPGKVDPKAFLDECTQEYLHTSGLEKKSGWGYDQMKWLVTSSPINATESCWNWRSERQNIHATLRARGSTYNGYPVSSGYFGSYSLDGLALALWSVYHTDSFDAAVARSVNLFGDADSHGSITGQIAGAIYGYRAINPQFKTWLNTWDDHDFAVRGLLLHHLGSEYGVKTHL